MSNAQPSQVTPSRDKPAAFPYDRMLFWLGALPEFFDAAAAVLGATTLAEVSAAHDHLRVVGERLGIWE